MIQAYQYGFKKSLGSIKSTQWQEFCYKRKGVKKRCQAIR
jgi:hypothetical protein